MSVLSRQSILRAIADRHLVVEPFDPAMVQSDGIDVRLGPNFLSDERGSFTIPMGDYLYLEPGETMLAATLERVEIPNDMTGNMIDRSSIGRLFVLAHVGAGSHDPRFRGYSTLELVNLSRKPVRLLIGGAITKLQLHWMDRPVDGYDGRYQDQGPLPVASRLEEPRAPR